MLYNKLITLILSIIPVVLCENITVPINFNTTIFSSTISPTITSSTITSSTLTNSNKSSHNGENENIIGTIIIYYLYSFVCIGVVKILSLWLSRGSKRIYCCICHEQFDKLLTYLMIIGFIPLLIIFSPFIVIVNFINNTDNFRTNIMKRINCTNISSIGIINDDNSNNSNNSDNSDSKDNQELSKV